MTEKTRMERLKQGVNKALIAGSLAVTGCDNSPTPQQDAPATYLSIGPERLRISLLIGKERIPLQVEPGENVADLRKQLEVDITRLLEHPENYDSVTLELTDKAGELPVCTRPITIAPEDRTIEGLRDTMLLAIQPFISRVAMHSCSERWAPITPLQETEPREPKMIVSQERTLEPNARMTSTETSIG